MPCLVGMWGYYLPQIGVDRILGSLVGGDVFEKYQLPNDGDVAFRAHAIGQALDEWADTNFTNVYDESLVNGVEDTIVAGRAARLFSVFGFDHTEIVVAFVRDVGPLRT